jgi:hypothetical protein
MGITTEVVKCIRAEVPALFAITVPSIAGRVLSPEQAMISMAWAKQGSLF